jgi:hypothetical protein
MRTAKHGEANRFIPISRFRFELASGMGYTAFFIGAFSVADTGAGLDIKRGQLEK